jgi:nicotinate phosphoribosyltransferase
MRNLTLLTDLYQLTMSQGYFKNKTRKRVVFDLFYRKNPSGNGFAICTGLDQVIDYIQNLHFSEEDCQYLKNLGIFEDSFIEYLKGFRFTGDIYAIPEGTIVFPYETLIRVEADEIEAQFIETALLTIVNHQTLIATKAARVREAAGSDIVMEFGLRRAQGPDAGIYGARAAVIGGCNATSNVLSGKMFNIPIKGTMAHSWIMSFASELEAFFAYADSFPTNCILLVDTYDTLKSGVPNAIKTFQMLKDKGILNKGAYGIRLDSGDLAYLSKEARKMLDQAGFPDAIISASNDLDENIISALKQQGSQINSWGVGTKLITSEGCSALGGVYKLAAEIAQHGEIIPKIKISENIEKVTNPGIKNVARIIEKDSNKIKADIIILNDEVIREDKSLVLMDETYSWKQFELKPGSFTVEYLLRPIFINGQLVYNRPSVSEIKDYYEKQQKPLLWDEYRRLVNPPKMKVNVSDKLYDLKKALLYKNKTSI